MSELQLTLQLLASMLALTAAYALVMSLLKREVNALWARWEGLLTLIFSGFSLGLSYERLFHDISALSMLSLSLLTAGLAVSFVVVALHRIKLAHSPVYADEVRHTTLRLGLVIFVLLLCHIFAEVAFLAGF